MTDQNKYVFWVENKHAKTLDEAPKINGSTPNHYYGYFENELREQLVFEYDYATKTGTLWMGDVGWGKAIAVVNGDVQEISLDPRESRWLQLCWDTATIGAKPSESK